jgi:hypothetical protein
MQGNVQLVWDMSVSSSASEIVLDNAPRLFLYTPVCTEGDPRRGAEEADICGAMVSFWSQC